MLLSRCLVPSSLALVFVFGCTKDPDRRVDDPSVGCDDVAGCLSALGVDVDVGPRRAPDGSNLPEAYGPLGSRAELGAVDPSVAPDQANDTGPAGVSGSRELFLVGPAVTLADAGASWIELDATNDSHTAFDSDLLSNHAFDASDVVDVIVGDFDADGMHEVGWLTAPASGGLWLQRGDDRETQFRIGAAEALVTTAFESAQAAVGDVDGDGDDDLVVALVVGDEVELRAFEAQAGSLVERAGPSLRVRLVAPQSEGRVRLDTGNLDYDAAAEVVVVVNERYDAGQSGITGYFVLDDATADFAEVASGEVAGVADGTRRSAAYASVALGDVDGDTIDEILLGGISDIRADPGCGSYYVLVALDDLPSELAPLATARACAHLAQAADEVYVDTFDVDGDNVAEVHVNQLVFDDLRVPTATWGTLYEAELGEDDPFAGRLDSAHLSMATGDVTQDGREDLLVFVETDGDPTLTVWGVEAGGPEGRCGTHPSWCAMHEVAVASSPVDALPHVVTASVDADDTAVLTLSEGSHEVVYTEPVILAVLAAAPCHHTDVAGQNPSSCITRYGTSETSGGSFQHTTTVTVGAGTVIKGGVDVPFVGEVEAEFTQKLQASLGRTLGSTYSITKSVTYTTAPLTDEVVFTSIPLDVYTYQIVSHPVPELVGKELVLTLPRDITTYKVALDHYEAHVVAEGPRIAEVVLHHEAGDPWTYPTREDKDALVDDSRLLLLALIDTALPEWFEDYVDVRSLGDHLEFLPLGDLVPLEVGPVAVNPGAGRVDLALTFSSTDQRTFSARVERSSTLKLTTETSFGGAGYVLNAGVTRGANFTVLHGSATTYAGRVSDIPEEQFEGNGYQWGLFTYLHQDPSGQQFDVVNYWVE